MNLGNNRICNFIKSQPDGIRVSITVKPGAKKNSIDLDENSMKVKISAPPVDGKANAALIKYFSEVLDIPKSAIEIEHGISSKNKVLKIYGITLEKFYHKISL